MKRLCIVFMNIWVIRYNSLVSHVWISRPVYCNAIEVNSASHPSGVGKSKIEYRPLAGFKTVCQVAGNIV